MSMKIVEIPIDEVKEYEDNPRDNSEAVTKVAQSIQEFGFINPIAIDRSNVIIAGHTRLLAARQLGYETVPCIYHDIDEDEARVARIAENRTHEFSTWDIPMLMDGLKTISNPTKGAFFAPASRDRLYYEQNKILAFGKVEIGITEEDEEIFEAHFTSYIDKHGSHLGFVNYLIGGLLDA